MSPFLCAIDFVSSMRSCGVRFGRVGADLVVAHHTGHHHIPTGGPLDVDQSVIGVFAHM